MADQEKSQVPQKSADVSKPRIWQVGALVATLISGGAMGAIINNYFSTRKTVVSYSLNSTSLGAGEATKSVLPTLKLQLDNAEIPVVYTHTIELSYASGPELDQMSIGITLGGAKLYGNPVAAGPDVLHQITCKYDQIIRTVLCSTGRISSKNSPYRIILATDQASQVTVAIDGKNTEIEAVQHATPEVHERFLLVLLLAMGIMCLLAVPLMFYWQKKLDRLYKYFDKRL